MMKTVLWISRHEMTPEQFTDLERALGGSVRLLPWRETVEELSALKPLLRQADAVAAVLPPGLLARLLAMAGGKPVLQAISKRVPTGRTRRTPTGSAEPEFRFVHGGWQQILKLELETRTL